MSLKYLNISLETCQPKIYLGLCTGRCTSGLDPRSLLFVIYINDIVNELRASVRFFADDTSLYIIADTPLCSSGTK